MSESISKINIPENIHISSNDLTKTALQIADKMARSLIECSCLYTLKNGIYTYDINQVDSIAKDEVEESIIYLLGRQKNSSSQPIPEFTTYHKENLVWFKD